MDAVIGWLAQYGLWGLVMAVAFVAAAYIVNKIASGDWVPARTVEREQQNQKDLAAAVERMADSLDRNTDAILGVQAGERNLEEGQRAQIHLLEEIQRRGQKGTP